MIEPKLQLLIEYRLREAQETLREAQLLLNQSALRGCINWFLFRRGFLIVKNCALNYV